MELEAIKKLIKRYTLELTKNINEMDIAEKYYNNQADILEYKNPVEKKTEDEGENPLKNADNRVPQSWHTLLVDQATSYLMATPPSFDTGEQAMNDEIVKLLGQQYPKIAKSLCMNALNSGTAWLHVWKDEEHENFFRYSIVDSRQILPIFSHKLDNELIGCMRAYDDYLDDGTEITVYELWNAEKVSVYWRERNDYEYRTFQPYYLFSEIDNLNGEVGDRTNEFMHDWGAVPFIPFKANHTGKGTLNRYKKLIDVYDQVYSGFVNDIEDVQQVILILTNYGGQDKVEFLKDLKQFKVIKNDGGLDGDEKGQVDKLIIDIPTEARKLLLEMTREAIFVHGQGVDPQKSIGQDNSGVALKYMYSLLELKAGNLETEFRLGFDKLVKFILKYSGKNPDEVTIEQRWERSAINNDLEKAQIVSSLSTVTSKESIAKANPLVDDWQEELQSLENETMDDERMLNDYRAKSKNPADDEQGSDE